MSKPAALALDTTNFRPGDRLCCAVSGGADSVALLLGLHQNRAVLGIGLSAVHVNHGLRGSESDSDQQFVQALCSQLEVSLHLHRTSVPDRVTRTRESIEEAARMLRYQFFATLLDSGEADAVLTAHTLEDQAETVILKLLRGAWTEGLGGIFPVLGPGAAPGGSGAAPARGRIVRPLLQTRRAEVESFLRGKDQPWREDSSNADPSFTRNRVRHTILPLLRQENPSIDKALANLAELARYEEAHWQTELSRLLPQLLLPGKPVRGGGRSVSTAPHEASISIEIERLRVLDHATRRRILRAGARQMGVRLDFDETNRLLALCGFRVDPTVAPRSSTVLHLSGDLRAQRTPRELRLYLQRQQAGCPGSPPAG